MGELLLQEDERKFRSNLQFMEYEMYSQQYLGSDEVGLYEHTK